MAKFHQLKVSDVRKETADCVSIAFEVPASLKEEFKYTQGQYLTIKLTVNGEELRRSYSLCSSPAEPEIRIAVKQVKDGRGSLFLNTKVKAGDELSVMSPMGNFYSNLGTSPDKNYVLFAGGSGITPMLSIIKTILKSEPRSNIQLIYGNRDTASIIFKSVLDELASANSGRLTVRHILENPPAGTDPLYTGLLSKEKVTQLLAKEVKAGAANEYFICGPGPMMENVKLALEEQKIPKDRIHIEYFTAVLEAVNKAEASGAGGEMSHVTVIMDGRETEFELSSGGMVILDKALEEGLDVPYACKGAVCCTCRAKVLEGKVKMDNNYALTDNEVKEGYILTCQSHPITPKVVVDYDV